MNTKSLIAGFQNSGLSGGELVANINKKINNVTTEFSVFNLWYTDPNVLTLTPIYNSVHPISLKSGFVQQQMENMCCLTALSQHWVCFQTKSRNVAKMQIFPSIFNDTMFLLQRSEKRKRSAEEAETSLSFTWAYVLAISQEHSYVWMQLNVSFLLHNFFISSRVKRPSIVSFSR